MLLKTAKGSKLKKSDCAIIDYENKKLNLVVCIHKNNGLNDFSIAIKNAHIYAEAR